MKKFIFLLIMIFSLSFFCGCQKQNYTFPQNCIFSGITFYNSGEICQTVAFGVDSKKIEYLSRNQKEEVEFKSNLLNQVDMLRQKFLLGFAVVYLQNPKQEFKIGSAVKVSPTAYKAETDMMSFDIIFTSLSAWQYYHKVSSETSEKQTDNVFLIEKKSNKSDFPFAVYDKNKVMVGESYKNLYLSASEGLSFNEKLKEEYKPKFIYQYATFSNKIKSNSDYKFNNGQIYFHVWEKNENQLLDSQTEIYYYQINKATWILFALLIPSLSLGCYLFYKKIKEKRKREK